jgi:two-component system phosphate regulon sensor histidine kinase PhoR
MAGLATILLVAAVSGFIARRTARPLEDLKRTADRIALGDLQARARIPDTVELAGLARALNQMAARLDDRINAVVAQRNEIEAVLASMAESVLAVDEQERIININPAAGALFGIAPALVRGRSVAEVIRNPDLQQFVGRVLAGAEEPAEAEFTMTTDEEHHLQAHGSKLADGAGQRIGALIVLNDVTRLKRLEAVRREFVANVSHELRTPITSIKGYAETLLDGALDSPDDARRFLAIVARQADRLEAIVEDLLSLSRIEHGAERGEIALERHLLAPLLKAAAQTCEARAVEKAIPIQVSCAEGLTAAVNLPLLEQAIVNLLDNAIKYSEPGSPVQLVGRSTGREVLIQIVDRGAGIEKQHLGRIFERFYRVDKARSRALGGTGLGLAIVKHITLAHRGQVAVESAVGQGSTFTLQLPLLAPEQP